ncbi:MAG TPA: hypothetical protein VKC33_04340 [Burkholderiales bacterium]|nr:hypothetical protein [Burkholderiales bacterium]
MPQLKVSLKPTKQELKPGDTRFRADFVNASSEPATLNLHAASHPALALQVRDGKGEAILLPPPGAPEREDLEPGSVIPPGQSVTLEYAGFLDRSLTAGEYRVRYFSKYSQLGGRRDDPLVSEWVDFRVRPANGFPVGRPVLGVPLPRPKWWELWFIPRWLICLILRWLGLIRCDRVFEQEVDEARTETISNAPPGAEAWNGTYGWRARFHQRVEQPTCRVLVTVRVRLVGTLTAAQQSAWQTAIDSAWSNRFKNCAGGCCCGNGYTIRCELQYVSSGEHQVVTVGTSTTSMTSWGATDTVDVNHEYGHMLGALDEYFTVNGVDYGAGRQATGDIMNNPANQPIAAHYELVRATTSALLGTACSTIPVANNC